MKITMNQLQDVGKSVQDEYNNFSNILHDNLKERIVTLNGKAVSSNVTVSDLNDFKNKLNDLILIGLNVKNLKLIQEQIRLKIEMIEIEIGTLRTQLFNLKKIRLALYSHLNNQIKGLTIVEKLKFDKTEANKILGTYINDLYSNISEKRKELWILREAEVVELTDDNINIIDTEINVAPNNQNSK